MNRRKVSAAVLTTDRRGLDSARIRFNWGYHDAAHEVQRGHERLPVNGLRGPNNGQYVDRKFNEWYYAGYVAGLAAQRAGLYAGCSEAAWLDWLGALDETEWRRVFAQVLECEIGDERHLYSRPRLVTSEMVARAYARTAETMGAKCLKNTQS